MLHKTQWKVRGWTTGREKTVFFFAEPQQNKCSLCHNDFTQRDYCCKPCLRKITAQVCVCVCVCVSVWLFIQSPPPPSSSHSGPFLWLTWGRFWSSSWSAETHNPAPPCTAPDSRPGTRPAGWRRWQPCLVRPGRRCSLSSSGCRRIGASPCSQRSGKRNWKTHRLKTHICTDTIDACVYRIVNVEVSV